ncbi:MAG: Gfo/Idh/MocA family oxidoreductase [Pirellulales bacterium]|nr:Gfo/Idh/MocA family oxidoreductase [Pirellulales bacterium]
MVNSDKPNHARRDFLKSTAVAASAAAVGSLSLGRAAHAAGSDILKVGLIGCGGRGTGAAANALTADTNTKLVAMGDVFENQVQNSIKQLKKNAGIAPRVAVDDGHCFVGFDAYTKVIESGVDVVVLATPPAFRPEQLKAAVDAGKHVFCEKPVAVDAPGIRSVLESSRKAKEKNLSIVSGLCWRYDNGVKETMQRVLDGAIGDIKSMQETYLCGMVGRSVQRTPQMSEMEYQMRSWYFFNWISGDFNVEQHVHSLDKASWLMGDKPPIAAWGIGGRQTPKLGNIYDHFGVVYEYADGVKLHAYCRQQSGCWSDVSDQYIGTKGTVNVLKHTIQGENEWRFKGSGGNMYVLEHEALFKAIRSGKPKNDGHYMSTSSMLGIMGRMVGYTGKRITWDQAINSKQKLTLDKYAMDVNPPVMPNKEGKYDIAVPGVTPFV